MLQRESKFDKAIKNIWRNELYAIVFGLFYIADIRSNKYQTVYAESKCKILFSPFTDFYVNHSFLKTYIICKHYVCTYTVCCTLAFHVVSFSEACIYLEMEIKEADAKVLCPSASVSFVEKGMTTLRLEWNVWCSKIRVERERELSFLYLILFVWLVRAVFPSFFKVMSSLLLHRRRYCTNSGVQPLLLVLLLHGSWLLHREKILIRYAI